MFKDHHKNDYEPVFSIWRPWLIQLFSYVDLIVIAEQLIAHTDAKFF